jgi:molybdenum cofactor cytidylyltransferase
MICALVLAAGQSRRMGTQKLLLPLEGKPVVVHVVDGLLRSPVDRIVVVIGEQGREIREAMAGRRVHFVTNPDAEGEMLSSVRCGLTAVPPQCAAALVALGDQPSITANVVAELVQAFWTSGRGIVVPTYRGRRGHPLVLAMHYRDEILTRYEDVGLRGLIEAHPEDVVGVEVTERGILEDIDAPEDYRRMLARFSQRRHR